MSHENHRPEDFMRLTDSIGPGSAECNTTQGIGWPTINERSPTTKYGRRTEVIRREDRAGSAVKPVDLMSPWKLRVD